MNRFFPLLILLLLANLLDASLSRRCWLQIRAGAISRRDTDEMFITEDQLRYYEEESDIRAELSSSSIDELARAEVDSEVGNGRRRWLDRLPRINLMLDPVVNFKTKQKLKFLGVCMTIGVDYLSDLAHWKMHYSVEDTYVGGRFTLRGSELGWAKSWLWNMVCIILSFVIWFLINLELLMLKGMSDDNTAKLKLRMGLNLHSWKMYARLRFRTEPISPFDLGEGEYSRVKSHHIF
jgi:hypothetical protein